MIFGKRGNSKKRVYHTGHRSENFLIAEHKKGTIIKWYDKIKFKASGKIFKIRNIKALIITIL